MAGLDHAPLPDEPRDPDAERHNARLGLVLFAVYSAGYAGFVGATAVDPAVLDAVPAGGVNLAVLGGLGLIAGAAVVAAVYMLLCRRPAGGRA